MNETITKVNSVSEAARILTSDRHGRKNLDDSFWIFDITQAADAMHTWQEMMPLVTPCYAMKAAPHRRLIKYLLLEGGGLDCASQEEIDIALQLGASPDDIVVSNPIKQISHLEHAKEKNVNLTVFDCEEELEKIKKHHPKAEFGASLEQCKRLIELSKELEMMITGVCFHVGSGCYGTAAYADALKDSRELFDFAKSLDLNFNILNIGGGFQGVPNANPPFKEYARTINESLAKLFPKDKFPNLRIIAEPGRYFACAPFTLVTNVIGRRDGDDENDLTTYTLNDGMFGSLRYQADVVCKDECEPYLLGDEESRASYMCRVCGPTCSPHDVIQSGKVLPELYVGDWLLWKNCGAYTFAVASNFNGYKQGLVYEILSGDEKKIPKLEMLQNQDH